MKLTAFVRKDEARLVWTVTLADKPEYTSSHPDLKIAKDLFAYSWADIVATERELDEVTFEFVE